MRALVLKVCGVFAAHRAEFGLSRVEQMREAVYGLFVAAVLIVDALVILAVGVR